MLYVRKRIFQYGPVFRGRLDREIRGRYERSGGNDRLRVQQYRHDATYDYARIYVGVIGIR